MCVSSTIKAMNLIQFQHEDIFHEAYKEKFLSRL